MEENLGELIFDIMVEEYNDKIEKSKNIEDYLKEKNKQELISLYFLYRHAGAAENIVEDVTQLMKTKKENIIKQIVVFLDSNIVSILQFMNKRRMEDINTLANYDEFYKIEKNHKMDISLDTIKILKQLGFIFCKKVDGGIVIHMPDFIKNKIKNLNKKDYYLDYYDEILLYSKGMAETYGAINIHKAYEIINKDIPIEFEKYSNIIKFVSILELDTIYYSFKYITICNFNLRDEELEKLMNSKAEIVKYNREFYENIANNNYIFNLKEYKEFREFLKDDFELDINEDELLRGEIINDYIDISQTNKDEAKNILNNTIDRYFEVDDLDKFVIIRYIDKIKSRMPKWMLGGAVEKENLDVKIGRNDRCLCGSGKKFKNCCGR